MKEEIIIVIIFYVKKTYKVSQTLVKCCVTASPEELQTAHYVIETLNVILSNVQKNCKYQLTWILTQAQ